MANQWWGVICDVGVWGWVLSAVGFILGAFPARDRFNGKQALIWGAGFLFFYALWVVGMMHA
jgi:hypothetical protein